MTREEAINIMKVIVHMLEEKYDTDRVEEAVDMAIKALEQEPCEDCISRAELIDKTIKRNSIWLKITDSRGMNLQEIIDELPSIQPKPKTGHCKDCKYFEYDSVANVDGIPLIVAHEICKKWGDGCKTSEDGYCFLFEPQESEESE